MNEMTLNISSLKNNEFLFQTRNCFKIIKSPKFAYQLNLKKGERVYQSHALNQSPEEKKP